MGEVDDEFLLQCAHILGDQSAASRAIAERDRRRALGEEVVILWYRDRGMLLVGPPPTGRPSRGVG